MREEKKNFNKREGRSIGHIDIWFCFKKDDDFWENKVGTQMSTIASRGHGKSQIKNQSLLDMKAQGFD
jgi:hypothetical protein